jgi:hypothetical protein
LQSRAGMEWNGGLIEHSPMDSESVTALSSWRMSPV